MSFDEVIPCAVMGDMITNEMITSYPSNEQRECYTCGCRISRYNASDRCFPCRTKDRVSITESINDIFGGSDE